MKTIMWIAVSVLMVSKFTSADNLDKNMAKNDAWHVLRALEDFHQLLVTNEELAKFRVNYGGGLAVDSRAPGVWPKGRIGCWQISNLNGAPVATVQIVKNAHERDVQTIEVSKTKLYVRIETYGEQKTQMLALLRKVLTNAAVQKIIRIEDSASDKDIEKLKSQK